MGERDEIYLFMFFKSKLSGRHMIWVNGSDSDAKSSRKTWYWFTSAYMCV